MYRHLAPKHIPTIRPIEDEEILALWKRRKDTYDIAVTLGVPEYIIERRLHAARDAAVRNAEWNWPPEGAR